MLVVADKAGMERGANRGRSAGLSKVRHNYQARQRGRI